MARNPFDILKDMLRFRRDYTAARARVRQTDDPADKKDLAGALRALGEIERRTPFTQGAARRHYEDAVTLYRELDDPLKLAHTIRHLGLVHEDAGRLEKAEKFYDEALDLYRTHSTVDTLDYANAVRYPAVVKNRLGKRDESTALWEEACRRYEEVGIHEGVAEGAAWLTKFALERNDVPAARRWFETASLASSLSNDPATHKFVDEVRRQLEEIDD